MFRLRRKKRSYDPVAVVQRFVDAANRHDAQGVADCLHPDFDSAQPIYPSRNFRGSDQVRRNWQAIFQSEPGFRLTLLRSASAGDTVWVELHGAGKEVEVAGVFIMGVENNLVRWARVYSAVVDQEVQGPAETAEPPPAAVAADDGVYNAQVAAELRQAVEAGRLRVVAGGGVPAAADAAFGPEVEEDSLGTGEVPVAVVAEEAAAHELVAEELVAEELAAEDGPAPARAEDEAVVAAESRAATEASLDDLLGHASPPPPPGDQPVIELVRPEVDPRSNHDDEGDPDADVAVLELKPERRFGRPLRRP
ncbi:MAG: nuclear transport factor 2 family protein [Actinomycetota bacterium]|nr:nuclear transport factor 2 family protein [Actinomycetota bacterium]